MHSRTIEIDRKVVAYIDSAVSGGESTAGAALPLVLLHGLAGNAASFVRQFESFGAHRRVIAWHAPGYGDSQLIDADGAAYAGHLLKFLDALDIADMVLLGHSMGGMLAGKIVAMAPERVTALVLSCTHGGYAKPAPKVLSAAQQERLDDLRILGARDYGEKRAKTMSAAGAAPDAVALLADIAAQTRAAGLEAAMQMINGLDNAAALARYPGPVLIIEGAQDRVISQEKRAALHRAMPVAKCVVIDAAGHAPYLETPERYNTLLKEFLDAMSSNGDFR